MKIGDTVTVRADTGTHTGRIYHIRENGWPCVETPEGVIASGPLELRSQSARDAQAGGYGGPGYWLYLDEAAADHHDYFLRHGDPATAERMFTRSLSEALMGNDGD